MMLEPCLLLSDVEARDRTEPPVQPHLLLKDLWAQARTWQCLSNGLSPLHYYCLTKLLLNARRLQIKEIVTKKLLLLSSASPSAPLAAAFLFLLGSIMILKDQLSTMVLVEGSSSTTRIKASTLQLALPLAQGIFSKVEVDC